MNLSTLFFCQGLNTVMALFRQESEGHLPPTPPPASKLTLAQGGGKKEKKKKMSPERMVGDMEGCKWLPGPTPGTAAFQG